MKIFVKNWIMTICYSGKFKQRMAVLIPSDVHREELLISKGCDIRTRANDSKVIHLFWWIIITYKQIEKLIINFRKYFCLTILGNAG